MKTKFLFTICLSLAILTGAVNAQTNFDTFWTQFKSAVKKADKAAVFNLTKLPVSMPFGMRAIKNQSRFFSPLRQKFSTAKLMPRDVLKSVNRPNAIIFMKLPALLKSCPNPAIIVQLFTLLN